MVDDVRSDHGVGRGSGRVPAGLATSPGSHGPALATGPCDRCRCERLRLGPSASFWRVVRCGGRVTGRSGEWTGDLPPSQGARQSHRPLASPRNSAIRRLARVSLWRARVGRSRAGGCRQPAGDGARHAGRGDGQEGHQSRMHAGSGQRTESKGEVHGAVPPEDPPPERIGATAAGVSAPQHALSIARRSLGRRTSSS